MTFSFLSFPSSILSPIIFSPSLFPLFTELPAITRSPPDNRELVIGMENLVYTCEFEGYPTPRIDWFFNGQPISHDSGVIINDNTLMIASPQVPNSGIYQCIVSNNFGDAQAAWLLEIRPSSKWKQFLIFFGKFSIQKNVFIFSTTPNHHKFPSYFLKTL